MSSADGPHPDPFVHFLAEERLRSARQIAVLRLAGAIGVLSLSAVFNYLFPGFIGPVNSVLGIYAAVSVAVWAVRRRSARALWLDGLAIPLVDIPVVFFLFYGSIVELQSVGIVGDAKRLPYAAFVFFALFTMISSLSLTKWQVVLAATAAWIFQSLLIQVTESGQYYMISQGTLSLGIASALGLYFCNRTVQLVRDFAREQSRKERLGRYFSPQVAASLERDPEGFGAGKTVEVTVLFADIRGFTELAESLDGAAVVRVLNEFQERMVGCVFALGGTLDKYTGDGLMVYFGAPVAQSDHRERGVRCALAMQEALAQLNVLRRRRGAAPLKMGVGVHSGRVIVGDIGAPQRREFTAVGDTVNVASRIEQLTKLHDVPILVSAETHRGIDANDLRFTAVAPVAVKGKKEPVQTFVPSLLR